MKHLDRRLEVPCLPDASERRRGQARLQEDVSDLGSGHQAVHVSVRLAEQLVVLGLVCRGDHPLGGAPGDTRETAQTAIRTLPSKNVIKYKKNFF